MPPFGPRALAALAIVATLLVCFQPAPGEGTRAEQSGTQFQGHISGAATWNIAGSPYRVIGDVTIDPAGSLTLEPGVSVLFSLGKRMEVLGELNSTGTVLNRISFTSAQANPSTSDWSGIFVRSGAQARFAYTSLHYSKAGINATGGQVSVSNCTLTYHVLSAVRAGAGTSVTVVDSRISSCQYDGLMYDNGSFGHVRRNNITNCQYGVVVFSDAEVANNRFDEDFIGIYSYNNTGAILGNSMTSCWDGIIVFYADPLISGNHIQGCLGNATRFFVSNATYTHNVLEYNRIGLDIPYDSRGVLANMSGNSVNGIDISNYYFQGVSGVRLEGLYFDSGWSAGYSGYLNGQGAFTFYDCRDIVIENCVIENNWHGLGLANSTVLVSNSTIGAMERSPGFLEMGSELTANNVSTGGVNYSVRDDNSVAMENEYVRALVRNETLVPIEGAACEFLENDVSIGTYHTDATGHTPWVLAQDRFHTNISGTFVNEVGIDVTFEGRAFDDDPRTFELGTSRTITFTDLGDIWAPELAVERLGGEKSNLTPVFILTFSEEMDRASVEAATTMSANVTLIFVWDGWNATVTPSEPLEYETTYTLTITAGATDLRGNPLDNPQDVHLVTEDAPPAISDETLMYVAIGAGVAVFIGILAVALVFRKTDGPRR